MSSLKSVAARVVKIFRYWHLLAKVAVGGILLWSGLCKIGFPYAILTNVYEYDLFGTKTGALVAMGVPWLEVTVGLCLLGGIFLRGAFCVASIILCLEVFAQLSALLRAMNIKCGCFGISCTEQVTWVTVLLSGVLAGAAIAGMMSLRASLRLKSVRGECGGCRSVSILKAQ